MEGINYEKIYIYFLFIDMAIFLGGGKYDKNDFFSYIGLKRVVTKFECDLRTFYFSPTPSGEGSKMSKMRKKEAT